MKARLEDESASSACGAELEFVRRGSKEFDIGGD